MRRRSRIVVLKIGGELIESAAGIASIARVVARVSRTVPLAVVHGGGRDIDTALVRAAIPKRQVDGLRITDEQTMQVVVGVLAGTINTRLVAAINAAGAPAVGLTGADAGMLRVRPARPHRATNGALVDLGLVGEPAPGAGAPLMETLCRTGFLPVVACVGATRDGELLNVNADTLAATLAARVGASRLIFAGGTAGVLDSAGRTITSLTAAMVDDLIESGTATAGMVTKLRASRAARMQGVPDVAIVDGRSPRLASLVAGAAAPADGWTSVR